MNSTSQVSKVFQLVVRYADVCRQPQYYPHWNEAIIDAGGGFAKPSFMSRFSRWSNVVDDFDFGCGTHTAASFCAALRQARKQVECGRLVTLCIKAGEMFKEEVTMVFANGDNRPQFIAEEITSDAAKMLVDYLTTGEETALLVLSDYLTEKLGLSLTVNGQLADEEAERLAKESEAHERSMGRKARMRRFG